MRSWKMAFAFASHETSAFAFKCVGMHLLTSLVMGKMLAHIPGEMSDSHCTYISFEVISMIQGHCTYISFKVISVIQGHLYGNNAEFE